MDTPTTPLRPVRVTTAHESEVVVRGLAGMLATHPGRVQFVPPYPSGLPASGVDITLHDSLSSWSEDTVPPARPLVPQIYDGVLVTYTWNMRPGLVELALAHGARGCLAKTLPAAALVAAIEAVHGGEVVVEHGSTGRGTPLRSREARLTPREAEVVRLITQGLDNLAIAEETSLSINSVKTYIRAAYQKMGVSSRSQAVLWGVRHGFLDAATDRGRSLVGLTG